jgi:hypothetical protein
VPRQDSYQRVDLSATQDCRASDNDTVDGGADVLGSGRDPDRRPRWPGRWRLVAGAAAVALIGAGITTGLRLTGQLSPPNAAVAEPPTVPVMPGGERLRLNASLGTLLLGGPGELRLLNAGDEVPAALGWANGLLGVTGSSRLGPSPAVRQIAPVSGGVVALLGSDAAGGYPAIGAVFFIPVTSRGAAAPHLIAWASYLAVAPNQRDIWVERPSAPPGRGPGGTWLVDESGRRLSPALRLHGQILLAATVRGLLTQGPSGQGASLINPASGVMRPAGVPGDAFVVAAGPDDVAWQPANCGDACSLHITSLRDGTDTAIPLPPRTFPDDYPAPAAFGPAGRRLALPMVTTNREDRVTGTSVYVVDIGLRRLVRLPGGPIPPSAIPAYSGAARSGSPDIVLVQWAGSGLWIVATDGQDSQVAYWAGAGPLRMLAPMPGAAYTFAVAADATAAASG